MRAGARGAGAGRADADGADRGAGHGPLGDRQHGGVLAARSDAREVRGDPAGDSCAEAAGGGASGGVRRLSTSTGWALGRALHYSIRQRFEITVVYVLALVLTPHCGAYTLPLVPALMPLEDFFIFI